MISTSYAVLLSFGLALLVVSKLTIWHQLGTTEKFWTIFASSYAAALVVFGILHVLLSRRVFGFTHALLMLGIAGFVLYGLVRGEVSSPGKDDAAAGIVAIPNLAFIVGGALAAICGSGVMSCVFSRDRI